jgi:hypothetical protein
MPKVSTSFPSETCANDETLKPCLLDPRSLETDLAARPHSPDVLRDQAASPCSGSSRKLTLSAP